MPRPGMLLLVQSPDFTSIPLDLPLLEGGMTLLLHLTWRWKDYNILKLLGTGGWLKKQQIYFPTCANKVWSWLGTLKRKQGNSKKQTVQLQTRACHSAACWVAEAFPMVGKCFHWGCECLESSDLGSLSAPTLETQMSFLSARSQTG